MRLQRPNVAHLSAALRAAAVRDGTLRDNRDDAVPRLTRAPSRGGYNCPAGQRQRRLGREWPG